MADEQKTIQLKPFVHSGEVILREDGKAEVVPLQLFRVDGGGVVLRIGRTILCFTKDGDYDGPEMKGTGLPVETFQEIVGLLAKCSAGKGKAPKSAYFHEESNGYARERAGWPK